VILITAFADVQKLKLGLNMGAAHLLEKPFRAAELIDVIEDLLGQRHETRLATERVLRSVALTDKELTVARHLLDGLSSTEIAEMELNSAKTIRQHVSRIYAKFGVSSRADFFRLVYSSVS
jgi:DNA-binding NarL/FixJ family response regulator